MQAYEGAVELREFAFHVGDRLPVLRLHYTAFGAPQRDASGKISNAVLLLRGTGRIGKDFLMPSLAELSVSGGPAAGRAALLPGDA